MSKKKVVLATFSHVNLAFVSFLKEKLEDDLIIYRFSHTDKWRLNRKGLFFNFFIQISLAYKIYLRHRNDTVILYGNQLCRLFFPFYKKNQCIYCFNELPAVSNFLINKYDKLIFRREEFVFLPSFARLKFLANRNYYVGNCSVLENITFTEINNIDIRPEKNIYNRAIIIGAIDKTRLGFKTKSLLSSLLEMNIQIDILPSHKIISEDLLNLGFNVLKPVGHENINDLLYNYDIGILSYESVSLNNFYAAPLKLYEYVNSGLKLYNMHRNAGIDFFESKYPDLFWRKDDKCSKLSTQYLKQRDSILRSAIESNLAFTHLVSKLL